jgi:hypothetical protein
MKVICNKTYQAIEFPCNWASEHGDCGLDGKKCSIRFLGEIGSEV